MSPEQFQSLDRAKFALTVRFQVKPEHTAHFLPLLVNRVRESREASTVVDFRLFTTEEPHTFTVFESFPSRAAWEEFSKDPETVAFLNSVKPLQAAPFEVQFLSLVDLEVTPLVPPTGVPTRSAPRPQSSIPSRSKRPR